MMDIAPFIRDIPDFPKPGILFKDITPLIGNAAAFSQLIKELAERYRARGLDAIVGVESRGFIFGAALAAELEIGFVPVRKPGKLPADKLREEYELEYGTDALEIHQDAFAMDGRVAALETGESDSKGSMLQRKRVLVIDDLLATGGTLAAAAKLVERAGGHVEELLCIVELAFLNGRAKLGDRKFESLMVVD